MFTQRTFCLPRELYFCFRKLLFFIKIKNEKSAKNPNVHEMIPLTTSPKRCVKPEIMYVRNEIAATESAYGNWVETWFTWSHWAPALAMIVVSDIGEQWSPQTAPAIHAEIEIILSGFPGANIAMQIGIRIPNVPHEVPVANARPTAITKIMAGRNILNPEAEPSTMPAT